MPKDQATRASGPRDSRRAPDSTRPGTSIAPIVALVLLVVAGIVSLNLLAVTTAGTRPGAGASGIGPIGPIRDRPTPDPSTVIVPVPVQRPQIRGTLLFSRTGNIWAASGVDLEQLTANGTDSSPTWSNDGSSIYLIETREKRTRSPDGGVNADHLAHYTLYYPVVVRMAPDGTDRTEVEDGLFQTGGGDWFSWLLDPDVSPDGSTLALVSDGEAGTGSVVLSQMPAEGGTVEAFDIRDTSGLGHSDPEWSPDGTRIAFTYNSRDSAGGGQPRLGVLTVEDGAMSLLRGQGYASPSWSPDGAQLAAERTTASGRDIVIVDAAEGGEAARLTDDGRSFAPAFSPDGTQIAYLHLDGASVDLRVMTLERGDGGAITLVDDRAVTADGSLDAASPPSWWSADAPAVPVGPSPSPASTSAGASTSPAP